MVDRIVSWSPFVNVSLDAVGSSSRVKLAGHGNICEGFCMLYPA